MSCEHDTTAAGPGYASPADALRAPREEILYVSCLHKGTGVEAPEAWLVNTAHATRLFGYPSVPLGKLVDWTADWVARGMPSLGKDTHYDVRDGDF